jgi:hypothetical protein
MKNRTKEKEKKLSKFSFTKRKRKRKSENIERQKKGRKQIRKTRISKQKNNFKKIK